MLAIFLLTIVPLKYSAHSLPLDHAYFLDLHISHVYNRPKSIIKTQDYFYLQENFMLKVFGKFFIRRKQYYDGCGCKGCKFQPFF